MGKLLSRRIAATALVTLILASTFGLGCARRADFVFPIQITGSVVDAADGTSLSDVTLTFESETIPFPRHPVIGYFKDGTIDLEYLLAFGRNEYRGLTGYKDAEDQFQIVVTREGYVPAVFDFALNELGDEAPYLIELGKVALWRN